VLRIEKVGVEGYWKFFTIANGLILKTFFGHRLDYNCIDW